MIRFLRGRGTACALLLAASVFLAFGARRGEMDTVFRKAVNICMECIGLG